MANGKSSKRSPRFKDMTTEPPFGFLRVVGYAGNSLKGKAFWTCLCDTSLGGCGATTVVSGGQLRSGKTKSCGCLRAIAPLIANTTHGMRKTPEYGSWAAMKTRCTNENSKTFADYGGRGIKVCERWLNSFENFLADMGRKPGPNYTLERENGDGDYEPGNCVWATRKAQSRNRRGFNRMFTINGRTQCLSKWAEERGVSVKTVRNRPLRGVPIDQALLPVKSK